MGLHYQPLPADLFDEKLRPAIQKHNIQLRELFALEGAIREPLVTRRSDSTVTRNADVQVHVTRITPDIEDAIAGSSTVIGAPNFTFGTANAVGSTNTAVATDSSIALFDTTIPEGITTSASLTGTASFAARRDHVHSIVGLTGTNPYEVTLEQVIATGPVATSVPTFSGTAGGNIILKDSDTADGSGVDAYASFTDSTDAEVGRIGRFGIIGSDFFWSGTILSGAVDHGFLIDVANENLGFLLNGVAVWAMDNTGAVQQQGSLLIDTDDTEALLVRKDSDAGDVFIVDTTNEKVGIRMTPETTRSLCIAGDTAVDTAILFYPGYPSTSDEQRGGRFILKHPDQNAPATNDILAFSMLAVGGSAQVDFGGNATTMYGCTQIGFHCYPNNETAGHPTTSRRMHITATDIVLGLEADKIDVGVNVESPGKALDILGGSVDGIRLASSLADATNKTAWFMGRHRTNAEQDLAIIAAYSEFADSRITYGGSSGSLNAATLHQFYAAANTTTVTGTNVLTVAVDSTRILGQTELRFYEAANYVGFEAPALTGNQIWVLPTADGNASETLQTDGAGTLSWKSTASEKSWAFRSRSGASGTTYAGGFYLHSGTANDFSGGPSFGTANASYAAHFFVVTGADTVDELTLTVTGTSINDTGTRDATPDSENIVIPNATTAGAYYETAKKWLGTVVITVASGTAKICDFGYAKYWDNSNSDFTVTGIESTWLGGATDTAPNIILRHHNGTAGNTDWAYTGSGATPPTALAAMATDHSTEDNVINGENGAWKRTDLNAAVSGSASEGTIFEIVTTANKTFELGNIIMRITS